MDVKLFKSNSWKYWLAYSVLALVILGPLLKPGFVLALDMIFTPEFTLPASNSNNYPFYVLLKALIQIIPADVIQKGILFLILVFSGVGMHRLIEKKPEAKKLRKLNRKSKLDIVRIYGKTNVLNELRSSPAVPAYFAGILYMMNPFTYERWMAGHFLLLAGYALLPWLLRSLFNYVNLPSWKGALRLAGWFTAVALLSTHIFVIAVLAAVIASLVYSLNAPQKIKYFDQILQNGALALLCFAIVNSFWLNSVLRGTSPINESINKFTGQHLEAFTTASHPQAGLLANVVSLHGFWLERFNRFVIPNKTIALSLPILLILLALVVVGVKRRLKQDRPQTITIIILAIIGFIIATGIHAPLWGGMNRWLLLNVPVLQGFREPQKFLALLALGYAYFGAYGLQALAEKAAAKKDSILNYIPTALLVVPLALAPVMPFGFTGQLSSVQYPASWYAFNSRLQKETGDFKVLFLPWHQYMSYEFMPRIIANPAPAFFGERIIAGDNAEFGDVFRDTKNPTSDFIEKDILGKAGEKNIGSKLATKKIKYVVLAHGPDWEKYIFLANQPQLELISQDNSLIVYRNKVFK